MVRIPKHAFAEGSARPDGHLIGDGEMADLIRAMDWESTSLGNISDWPPELRLVTNIMLAARHPMLLLWGPEMVLIYNDAFIPILTDRHPKALGARGREFWTDVWPVVGSQLESVLHDGQTVVSEFASVPMLRNGVMKQAFFSYNYSPIYDFDGKIAGIMTICQNVTPIVESENRRADTEQALRSRQAELDKTVLALHAERARLLSVVQQAPAFFALLEGPRHIVSMVNPLYMKLVGNREVLGKPLAEALPEAVEQGYITLLDRVITSGEPFVGQSARFDVAWKADEELEERYVDFVYQPLREADGTISGVIVLGVDVTDNKRTQKALIQNEKLAAVGRLAATIAHEIKNPLAAVTNLLFLAKCAEPPAVVNEYLNKADQELRRIAVITNQTLGFYKQTTKMQAVTGSELLIGVVDFYRGPFLDAGVAVEQRILSHGTIHCYQGEIRQVLNNLIGNAIDAMRGRGGRLGVPDLLYQLDC